MDIQTKKLNNMLHLLVTELYKLSVQELQEFKTEWENELIGKGRKQEIIAYCITVVDEVINYKSNDSNAHEK